MRRREKLRFPPCGAADPVSGTITPAKKNPPFHLIIYIGQKGESWGSYFIGILIELEIVACVVVADVLNHAGETLHVVWQKALLHVVAEQVAEQTAEVLMAWV